VFATIGDVVICWYRFEVNSVQMNKEV